jgi:hypothetical protein
MCYRIRAIGRKRLPNLRNQQLKFADFMNLVAKLPITRIW